jgi:hypothetical protein
VIKKILPLFFLLVLAPLARAQCGPSTPGYTKTGQTYAPTTPGLADVQAAISAENATPLNGDIIAIPAGNCSWNGIINANFTTTVTIQGATTISGNGLNCGTPPSFPTSCTATDNTIIADGRSSGGVPILGLSANGPPGTELRMTSVSFNANNNLNYNGTVSFGGGSSGAQMRMDHLHFYNLATVAVIIYQPLWGVVDHNVVDVPGGNTFNGFRLYGGDGQGYTPWNQATGFGTANFTFIENNTFNNGFGNDCNAGGRYVMRYNVYNTVGNTSFAQSHSIGSTVNPPALGCRAWEVYGNVENSSLSGGAFASEFQTSGTGLAWNNTTNGFHFDVDLVSDRDSTATYGETPPPNGWGYCGTAQTGSASNWDGNQTTGGSNGWPCNAQPGRGQGDLLQGTSFPNICDGTQGCPSFSGTWPRQYLEPVYMWDESLGATGIGLVLTQSPSNNILPNRDYYYQAGNTAQTSPTSPFNGTTGTGWGATANIPTTCTAGPGGTYGASPTGSYGVFYFDTTAQKGYVCSATNTWTLMYQPYTYPHPLVGGGTPQASPPSGTPTSGVVPQTVTVTNPNSGTTLVCYAANSTIPATNGLGTACTTGTKYTAPIVVSTAETLNLIAGVASDTDSTVVSYTYTAAAVPPTVTTTAATSITATTASAGGSVTSNGGASVTAEGVACGLTANPTTGSSCSVASGGTATPFTVSLTGLTASTTYHIRGYATNSAGTGYGSDLTFTTLSTCANPVAIGPFTVCNKWVNALSGSGTSVSVTVSPFAGNPVQILGFTCANSATCATVPTQTLTISDNINNPETCFVQAPSSPYSWLDSTIPDQVKGAIWYSPDGCLPSGITTFTLNLSGTGYYPLVRAVELKTGAIAPTGFWESNDNNSFVTTGTSISVPTNGATTHPIDLITGFTQTCGGSVPQTPGAGFTANFTNTPNQGYIDQMMAVSSTGTYNMTSSWSSPAPSSCGGGTGNNDSAFGAIAVLKGATGSITLSPTSQAFGTINVGASSANTTFTLTNNSASSATSLTIGNVGGNTADFVISGSTCTTSLAASASCTFSVKFSPSASGARSTTLAATYSGGDGASPQDASLTGTGNTAAAGVPSCTPPGGTFTGSSGPITCTDSSSGSIICYNSTGYIAIGGVGTCPLGSVLYSPTFPFTSTGKLYVWAGGVGYADSAAVLYSFTVNQNPVAPTIKIIVQNTQTQKVPITNSVSSGGETATIGPQTHTMTVNTTCNCTVTVATGAVNCSACPQTVTVTN